jgi:hypothetical protein
MINVHYVSGGSRQICSEKTVKPGSAANSTSPSDSLDLSVFLSITGKKFFIDIVGKSRKIFARLIDWGIGTGQSLTFGQISMGLGQWWFRTPMGYATPSCHT